MANTRTIQPICGFMRWCNSRKKEDPRVGEGRADSDEAEARDRERCRVGHGVSNNEKLMELAACKWKGFDLTRAIAKGLPRWKSRNVELMGFCGGAVFQLKTELDISYIVGLRHRPNCICLDRCFLVFWPCWKYSSADIPIFLVKSCVTEPSGYNTNPVS